MQLVIGSTLFWISTHAEWIFIQVRVPNASVDWPSTLRTARNKSQPVNDDIRVIGVLVCNTRFDLSGYFEFLLLISLQILR
jgi:hypothetical protein